MKLRSAVKILLGLVIAVTLFHLCILFKLIPYDIAWGGRLTNDQEMFVFESLSLALNILLGIALLIKGDYIKPFISIKVVHVILWIFLVLFALNTVGNLLAKTNFEKGFSILTLTLAGLLWIVLRSKGTEKIKPKS